MEMPSPDWDGLVRESRARRRRRKRRRQRVMLSLLTLVTAAVLAFIVVLVKDMAKVPTAARTTALSSSARVVHSATALAVVGTLAMSLTIETMTTKAAAVTQASNPSISRCQRRLRRRRRALRSRTSESQSGDGISMPSG